MDVAPMGIETLADDDEPEAGAWQISHIACAAKRGEKMFERYGFKVLNRAEITKYKAYYPESVYLSTVVKTLETAGPLEVTSRPRT